MAKTVSAAHLKVNTGNDDLRETDLHAETLPLNVGQSDGLVVCPRRPPPENSPDAGISSHASLWLDTPQWS